MGARPPQNDTGDPDVIEFGIAALVARLEEVSVEYPVTESQLLASIDNTAIPVDGSGNTVELSVALDQLPQQTFASESELLEQLHPVFEEQRRQAGGSIFGRLRALLPF